MTKEKIQPKKDENPFTGRQYLRAIGRRKTASARVKLYADGQGDFFVNHQPLTDYFKHFSLRDLAQTPLKAVNQNQKFDVNVRVAGGGERGQAEAVRLGLARALVLADEKLKPVLRKLGFLTVDARVKERKKPGLKRARRAPQWQKR